MSVPGSPQYVFDWYLDSLRSDTKRQADLSSITYRAIFLVQASEEGIITAAKRVHIEDIRKELSARYPFLKDQSDFDMRLGAQTPDPMMAKLLWEALHLEGPGPTGLYILGKPGVLDRWGAYVITTTARELTQPPPVPEEPAVPTFEEYFGPTVTDRPWTVAGAAELLEVEARRVGKPVTVLFKGTPLTCGNNVTAAYAVMRWYDEAQPNTQMTEELLNRVWNNPKSRKLLVRALTEAE